ncbi:vacuolar protein sorting-associated protein 72 homolog [Erythrolamprus reginae]|uniref:vacuolar protein sorting-associated protein 72 homolog n=1 Tax=Erythrolamprus reginae TaxID=121349 RepID=UPI00396C6750
MGARLAHFPLAASAHDLSCLAARLSTSACAGAAVANRAHGSGAAGGGGAMMAAAGGAGSSSASSSSSGLAGGRALRRTAGNRLSGLLDAEEEDEFYQTTYGGFTEESGDDEYKGDQSDSEDEVDSDFDIDEGDEPSSDQDDALPKRKRRVVTKAYKEPIKRLRLKKPDAPASSSEKTREERSTPAELEDVDSRKYMRQSTTEHTRQTFLRLQERQVQSRRKKGGGPSYDRPLTQEELLREAKITEELNLRSLETYERLEADKKRQVQKKRKCAGPTIRYYSGTMPLISDLGYKEENVDVEGLEQEGLVETPSASAPAAKCSRTFITFSDDETFERVFPRAPPPKLPIKEVCPVTHKTAVYRDPVTDIPYSNIRSFKIIREAYKKYITAHGLPSAGASAALAAGSPLPDPGMRPTRQKIIIKQSVPAN